MRAPHFWWEDAPSLTAQLLRPIGSLAGGIAARRMSRSGVAVGVPVICVGNFVVGGAGKTPIALAIGEILKRRGERPVFLSRGYGGKPSRAPVIVDATRHDAGDVGDEPLLLVRLAPTIVCVDRRAGARAAIVEGASILIMDDGLQNAALEKHLTFAVVDAEVGVGNGLCIPAGPLRAPLATQWSRVDALVVVGDGSAGEVISSQALALGKPVLSTRLCPSAEAAPRFAGRRVLAFAGIGRPEKFFTSLAEVGAHIVAQREFPDHYAYKITDLDELMREAAKMDAVLVTTEKDVVRIPPGAVVETLPVTAKFSDENLLGGLIDRAIEYLPLNTE